MEPPTGPPDRTPPDSEARTAVFTVVVERSGGVAGLLRRWTADIPDDGGPAARAAHRIAGLTVDNRRSKEARNHPDPEGNRAPSDRQLHQARSAPRDSFVWAVSCGDGALRCDEAGRRQDSEVDALIRTVTAAPGAAPGAT